MTILSVGLLQMTSGIDPDSNAAFLDSGIRDLALRGAKFVLTPEMSGLLDRNQARLFTQVQLEEEDLSLRRVKALAAELGIWILLGSAPVRLPDGNAKLANRSFLVDDKGQLRARYDKIHLFDVDLPSGERYRESQSYEAGNQARVAQTPWGKLGMTVCYDVRFPHLYRALAQAGATMICVPAAFTQVTGQAHWHALLIARAIETGAFILAPAQTGRHEDGRSTYGHSLVVAPWGEVLADAGDKAGGILVKLDLSAVEEARRRVPALTHDRSFALSEA